MEIVFQTDGDCDNLAFVFAIWDCTLGNDGSFVRVKNRTLVLPGREIVSTREREEDAGSK